MQVQDTRRLSDTELADELRTAKEELLNLRFQLATRQLKNYRTIPTARQRIARALAAMRERETASEGSNG